MRSTIDLKSLSMWEKYFVNNIMKTKLTKLAASAIGLALLSSSAIAQDEEKKGKKKGKTLGAHAL